MNLKDLTAILAVIGAVLFLLLRAASCSEATSQHRHDRHMECIKQGIYCGDIRR